LKIPKKTKRYCPFCKKHTEHLISQSKHKERGTLKKGSIARAMKRGLGTGFGNKGRWGSKPAVKSENIAKKSDLRFKCAVCNKTHTQRKGTRSKKITFE